MVKNNQDCLVLVGLYKDHFINYMFCEKNELEEVRVWRIENVNL